MEPRGAEVEHAVSREFRGELFTVPTRQQHRMAEVLPGLRVRQHVGDEQPLVDLDAVLIALIE